MKHFRTVIEDNRIIQKCKHCKYVSPVVTNGEPNKRSLGMALHLKKAHEVE